MPRKKLTLQNFIDKSIKKHKNRYKYYKVKYINTITKVIITCANHGDFTQKPNNHLRGQGCPKCRNENFNIQKRKSIKKLIKEFINIHGNKYNYSMFEYNNGYTPGKIICVKHGGFFQRAHDHLNGQGCPKCNIDNITFDVNEFVQHANIIHNNTYDYSRVIYTNSQTKIEIICSQHGIFTQLPNNHLRNHGCPQCAYTIRSNSTRDTQEEVIKKFNNIHNNKYDYCNMKYITNKDKIEIICKVHGSFLQQPNNHLNGQGCPKCGYVGCYTEHLFKIKPELKEKSAILYLIYFENNVNSFYKIGITTRTLKQRFRKVADYKINKVQTWELGLYDAFKIEQKILNEFNSFQYTPPIKIGGDTECFSLQSEELQQLIQQVCKYQNI